MAEAEKEVKPKNGFFRVYNAPPVKDPEAVSKKTYIKYYDTAEEAKQDKNLRLLPQVYSAVPVE
jgi:hypothetical protein